MFHTEYYILNEFKRLNALQSERHEEVKGHQFVYSAKRV